MRLSGLLFTAGVASSLPLYDNVTVLFQNAADIEVVATSEEAFRHSGPVYIQETGELCGGEKAASAHEMGIDVDPEVDAKLLPKGEKKYCVRNLENTRVLPRLDLRAPITPCLDSSAGDGGSISKGISLSVSLSGHIDPGLADPVLGFITVSTSFSAGVSVGWSFTQTCTAAAGDSVQMWVTPIVGLTDFEYRSYHKWRGQKHSYSDYKKVANFEFPVGGLQPAVECLKGQFADCGALTTNKIVLEDPKF